MSIQSYFDSVGNILETFDRQRIQMESMENFFYDITSNPSKYPWIICPIDITNFSSLRIANQRSHALNIYTLFEWLYTEIIKTFDSTYTKLDIYNIKIDRVIGKNFSKSSAWKIINKDIVKKSLIWTILRSPSFNPASSPDYSIIHSFIEWRWANAHFSIWSHSIDLSTYVRSFSEAKPRLIELHDKLQRYLIALKMPSFNTDFDMFV